jgi:hypothetical protein
MYPENSKSNINSITDKTMKKRVAGEVDVCGHYALFLCFVVRYSNSVILFPN